MTRVVVVAFLVAALAACGGDATDEGTAEGRELFESTVLETEAGCVTCHSRSPDEILVGPSLAGVATRAGTRVDGLDAEEYLTQSIRNPDAYVVEGFESGRMPSWGELLTDREVAALVDYLLTLEGSADE